MEPLVKYSYHGFIHHIIVSHTAWMHLHINTPGHVSRYERTCKLRWHKNALLNSTRPLQSYLGASLKTNTAPARLADRNLPWTTLLRAAPTLALCHENRQHGSKRIQEAAFSVAFLCVCVNAAVFDDCSTSRYTAISGKEKTWSVGSVCLVQTAALVNSSK